MYSTVEEIRLMLKEHVLEDMISNQYMDDEVKKEQETVKIVTDAIEYIRGISVLRSFEKGTDGK